MNKKLNNLKEELNDYKDELSFVLRATHCLVSDSGLVSDNYIMGMLHTERRLLETLSRLIDGISYPEEDNGSIK
ncbi:hypothetical protein KO525_18670 [Psychrosphaera sp. B3R10]|uniref:hypothetical protein n=1 Tax=unclassified Psychrosphaera TaxID=2641570 RepID=UPI001C089E47|nr:MULTISPECIES: hypothetical protein [unclassified Psychrosphaera]MBU2883013.1 hypothetical protein [Psychrosphaera sp. I2R16]MBU2991410.1 hypothetical protein [Psychrosphaera sp. B3R10]